MSQLIWNVIAIAAGVTGIIVGLILYFRGKREKEPSWAYETHGLVGRNSLAGSRIQVSYDGTPLDQASATRVLFWNAGRDPIKKQDIAGTFSIRLGDEVRILQHRVLQVSREEIEFRTVDQEDRVLLDFQFLGLGDGAYLEIIHTGSPEVDVLIDGTLIAHSKAPRFRGRLPRVFEEPGWIFRTGCTLLILSVIGSVSVGVIYGSEISKDEQFWLIFAILLGGVIVTLSLMALLLTVYEKLRKFPAWVYTSKKG